MPAELDLGLSWSITFNYKVKLELKLSLRCAIIMTSEVRTQTSLAGMWLTNLQPVYQVLIWMDMNVNFANLLLSLA